MVDETKDEKTKEEEVKEEEVKEEEKPLDKMTAPELREIAKAIPGVTGATAMKKAELLAIIKEYRGIEEEKPVRKKRKTSKKGVSIKELKKKIVSLREEKSTAREEKDKKKTNTLRRRINRLKKRTRKVVQA
jgi:hypothetical protein